MNVLRFLKTFSNVIITNKMHLFKKRITIFWIDVVVQLNKKTKYNIIKKQFAVINKMKKIFSELSLFFYMNDHIFYCYEAYKIRCEFVDNWQRNRIVDMIFYFIDKSKSNLIIDTIELKQKKIKQNWKTNTWR